MLEMNRPTLEFEIMI